MLNKQFMAAAFACILMLGACSSNEEVTPARKFISFKMDSAVVLSEQGQSYAFYSPADQTNTKSELLINGTTYDKDFVEIRLVTSALEIKPGTYTNTVAGNSMVLSRIETSEILSADETTGSFTVTLHSFRDSVAIGQFSGTLVSSFDGSLKTVKDGYFRMIYRRL